MQRKPSELDSKLVYGAHPAVRLQEIVDALQMQSEESSCFLDRSTGRIETVSEDLLRAAEQSSDQALELPAWQRPEWELAQRIVAVSYFEPLPTRFEVHEWAIMQDFAQSLTSEQVREELLHALHGAGAFRHFKSTVRRRNRVRLVCFPHRGVSADRSELVPRAADRLAVEGRNGGTSAQGLPRFRGHSRDISLLWRDPSSR